MSESTVLRNSKRPRSWRKLTEVADHLPKAATVAVLVGLKGVSRGRALQKKIVRNERYGESRVSYYGGTGWAVRPRAFQQPLNSEFGTRNAEFIRKVWLFPRIPSFRVPPSAFRVYSDTYIDSCDYAVLLSRLPCSSRDLSNTSWQKPEEPNGSKKR